LTGGADPLHRVSSAKLGRTVTPPIVFLSDFVYRNEWVGICHAVMNRVAPESHVVDLSHSVLRAEAISRPRLPDDVQGAGSTVRRSDLPRRNVEM